MTTPTLSYVEQARKFLTQAQQELDEGDLRQASEKGWGAAVQMVKAVANEREWEHFGHRSLYGIVGTLVAETGDQSIRSLFAQAGELHVNFYDGFLNEDAVRDHVLAVGDFVEKLRQIV